MTAVAADFDNDGWPDIYVACDSTPSLLFHNNHDGTFTEQGLERGVALSDDGMEQAGMGVGVGDFKLDGNLDIVKTHFAADTPAVYVNNGKGEFRDDDTPLRPGQWKPASSAGASASRIWTTTAIPISSGSPAASIRKCGSKPDQPYKTPRIVFRNLGNGRFEELTGEAGPGVEARHCSRGCAFGDFDNDGDLDILIVNQNEPPSLLRNDCHGRCITGSR